MAKKTKGQNIQNKSFSEIWKKSNKFTRVFSIVILACMLILPLLFLITLGDSMKQVLLNNLGDLSLKNMRINFLYSLTISFLISYSLFLVFGIIFRKSNLKILFWVTIFICLFVFIFGFFVINLFFGVSPLSLVLWDGGEVHGSISCNNSFGEIFPGKTLHCHVEEDYNLYNVSVFVVFEQNGSWTDEKNIGNYDRIYFVVPEECESIQFIIEGYDSNGGFTSLDVVSSNPFLTKEEFKDRRNSFLKYLIGLFAVVFISIPLAVINFRKLWRGD
jgi:hypothetical protein